MSETPQRHSHSGPGDGGTLPADSVPSTTSIVASGTNTLADANNTEHTLDVGAVDPGKAFIPALSLTSDPGADIDLISGAETSTQLTYHVKWDTSAGDYVLRVTNDTGQSVSYQWKVLEA